MSNDSSVLGSGGASSGFGWTWSSPSDDLITRRKAWERTQTAIGDAIDEGGWWLIDALPTTGKSRGAEKAIADRSSDGTRTPLMRQGRLKPDDFRTRALVGDGGERESEGGTGLATYLTNRGRDEQYEQFAEWCNDDDVTHYTLPSMPEDCPVAKGEYGEGWKARVWAARAQGATAADIHIQAEEEFGERLPCQQNGQCPYTSKWDFDPDDYDVILGHYSHAYVPGVTQDRAVLIDEFPSAWEQQFGGDPGQRDAPLAGPVTSYLRATEEIPYDSYGELINNRDDDMMRRATLRHIESETDGSGREVAEAFRGADKVGADGEAGSHALAPLIVYVMLDSYGRTVNGYERVEISSVREAGGVGLFDASGAGNRDGEPTVHLLLPPALYTGTVIGLDGTPNPAMWNLALGRHDGEYGGLRYESVMTEEERREYIASPSALGMRIIRCTDAVRSYANNPDYVNTSHDDALVEHIERYHGKKPGLISTQTALRVYESDEGGDLLDRIEGEPMYYGNLLGSNKLGGQDLGIVGCSVHYGDDFIRRWSAYADESVREPDRSDPEGRGMGLDYGEFGNNLLRHMREDQVLQAMLRFGRKLDEHPVVYVNTAAVPEWIEPIITADLRVEKVYASDAGVMQVLAAAISLRDDFGATDVYDHPSVDKSKQSVRSVLRDLADDGIVERRDDPPGYSYSINIDRIREFNRSGRVTGEIRDEYLENFDHPPIEDKVIN